MTGKSRRVKLTGGLPQSAHSIELREDGSLVAELYDFSDKANDFLGGDIAWIITVSKEAVPQVVSLLSSDPALQDNIRSLPSSSKEPMLDLLPLLPSRFKRYYDFKEWLEHNRIPHTQETDTWA